MPQANYHSEFRPEAETPRFLGVAEAADPMQSLMRELIDEIRGLRNDIRQEVLQREIAKLPTPIREA